MSRMKMILKKSATVFLVAILVTILVAWGCAVLIDVGQARPRSEGFMTDEFFWSIERWDRPGATFAVSEIVNDWGWSPMQATGAPDTPTAGDRQTAWASLTADGQREWLCLEYANAVMPKSVRVYENCSPGAVDRVTVFSADGNEFEAWRGKDPTSAGAASGISEIPLPVTFPISKLKLYINSPAVSGWNEIDAVGLVSQSGQVQWAQRATASSSYGAPTSTVPRIEDVVALLPFWADAKKYGPVHSRADAKSEATAIDGRGWPLAALWCQRDATTGNAIAGALGVAGKTGVPSSSGSGSIANSITAGFQPPSRSGFISVSNNTTAPTLGPALPIRIAWQGFFADVVFYTLVLAVLRVVITRPWRLAVELSRLRNGCCIACGYDLGYDFPKGCPECGWRRAESRRAGT